jgi:hypothetical protein
MLAVHAGQSATVIVRPAGCVIQFNTATADADQQSTQSMQTPKGTFSVRGHVLGMPVWVSNLWTEEGSALQGRTHTHAHVRTHSYMYTRLRFSNFPHPPQHTHTHIHGFLTLSRSGDFAKSMTSVSVCLCVCMCVCVCVGV